MGGLTDPDANGEWPYDGQAGNGSDYFDAGQPGGGDQYFDGGTGGAGNDYFNAGSGQVPAAGAPYYPAGAGSSGDGYFGGAAETSYAKEPVINANTPSNVNADGGDIPDGTMTYGAAGMASYNLVGEQPQLGRKISG